MRCSSASLLGASLGAPLQSACWRPTRPPAFNFYARLPAGTRPRDTTHEKPECSDHWHIYDSGANRPTDQQTTNQQTDKSAVAPGDCAPRVGSAAKPPNRPHRGLRATAQPTATMPTGQFARLPTGWASGVAEVCRPPAGPLRGCCPERCRFCSSVAQIPRLLLAHAANSCGTNSNLSAPTAISGS